MNDAGPPRRARSLLIAGYSRALDRCEREHGSTRNVLRHGACDDCCEIEVGVIYEEVRDEQPR